MQVTDSIKQIHEVSMLVLDIDNHTKLPKLP